MDKLISVDKSRYYNRVHLIININLMYLKNKVLLIFCLLCCTIYINAQYEVLGGDKNPLKAFDKNHLEVYLVYGVNNLQIRYKPKSSNYQWYKYKRKVEDAIKIESSLEGNTSIIYNPEVGYGYYIVENNTLINSSFIWLVDYKEYEVEFHNLSIISNEPCSYFQIYGDTHIPEIEYFLPQSGEKQVLQREYIVCYNTLELSDNENKLIQKEISEVVTENPFKHIFKEVPLCDTEIILKGDQFARRFGIEKSISTDFYNAVSVYAQIDTILNYNNADNLVIDEGVMSSPVDVHFSAISNTPVAAIFNWKIFKINESEDNILLIDFSGEEVDYTFSNEGSYRIELEVSDRTTICTAIAEPIEINISNTLISVPNAFSPGLSPGINDEFRIAYRSLVKFNCWIFNRWGVEIFHWSDPSKGWDGKYKGKYVNPGVYYYVIEAIGSDGKSIKKKGSINVFSAKE